MLKDAQRSTDAFNVFMFTLLFIGLFGIGAKIGVIYILQRENRRLLSFPCSSNLQLYFITQRNGTKLYDNIGVFHLCFNPPFKGMDSHQEYIV